MITNNYANGLEREIEELTALRYIALNQNYQEDVVQVLTDAIANVQNMLRNYLEGLK